jgi:hypothetical protein
MRPIGTRGLAPWAALATLAAAGAAAAAGYALTAPEHYRATAQLLVAPVPPSDPTFVGIDVLRDTGGKRTAAASAAALVRSPQIVDAVRAQLALRRSRGSLLHALDAHVVDGSDVVDVTVEDTSRSGAARLANTFANALVNQRSATFQSQLVEAIRRDEGLVANRSGGALVKTRLATLRALQARPDPTLRVASQAVEPTSAASPDLPRLVGIGAALGAGAGLLAVLALWLRRRDTRAAAQYDPAVSEAGLEKLVDRLEAKLAARESALAARERDLQAAIDELRATPAPAADDSDVVRRERELAAREAELAERVAAVTKRELELARRAAAAAAAEREREAAAPPPPREPPAPARPTSVEGPPGRYNLLELERLVEQRGSGFPDRVDEWRSYLFFLRDYAGPDGVVPLSFDWLIQDTFAELLE